MNAHLAKPFFATVLTLLGAAATAQGSPTPTNGNLPAGALPTSWDPTYNVCRGVDPACYHDWAEAARQNRVLVFTRTAGPRHANLGPRLAAGINPTLAAGNVVQNALKPGWRQRASPSTGPRT